MKSKPPDDDRNATPTSDAKIEANRRNAQKSTGPRTKVGKDRSRHNALTHGAYAAVEQVIGHGPFTEDDDEIAVFIDSIIDALDPRDVLEHAGARKIAKIALSERRLDCYEAALLQADGRFSLEARQVMGRSGEDYECDTLALAAISSWNQARSDASTPVREPGTTPEERASGPSPGHDAAPHPTDHPFQLMATTLRQLGGQIQVVGVWDHANTPTSQQTWRRAFEAIVKRRYPDPARFEEWIYEQQLIALHLRIEAEQRDQKIVAARSLATIERTSMAKGRMSRDLERALIQYALSRGREIQDREDA